MYLPPIDSTITNASNGPMRKKIIEYNIFCIFYKIINNYIYIYIYIKQNMIVNI